MGVGVVHVITLLIATSITQNTAWVSGSMTVKHSSPSICPFTEKQQL